MTRVMSTLAVCVAAGTFGCADPLVGNWENVDNDGELITVYADGTGEQRVRTSGRTSDGYQLAIDFTYDIEWEAGRAGRYDIEHECSRASVRVDGSTVVSTCSQAAEYVSTRYTSECELNARGDEIDCTTEFGNEYRYELTR